jgi:hypothetical protein
MPVFLLEVYVSRCGPADARYAAAKARRAADALAREGTNVLHLGAILVSEDETCFHLYEATSAEVANAAAQRAGFACGRITPASTSIRAPKAQERSTR